MAGKRKVAVFDLNGTLYKKSSKDEFFKFVVSKNKSALFKIFRMGAYILLKRFKKIDQTEFKENFFSYLDHIPPQQVEAYAREFWQREYPAQFNSLLLKRVKELKRDGVEVYIITGAFEIYVKPLLELYDEIDGFAGTMTEYRDEMHLIKGEACKGEVKVQTLEKLLGTNNFTIVETYSDRKEVLFEHAEKAFLIEDGKIIAYNHERA